MPVFDFNDEPKEEKKASECTYTVIRSNETTASPEHPILVLDNSNRKWEHHSWGVFTNPIRKTAFEFQVEGGGTVSADMSDTYKACENHLNKLKSFSASRLSRENQITLDMLLLYFHTRLSLKGNELLEEMLSPSLGTQAQLPVLLAEYAFYEDQDIADYLNLLSSVKPYFQSILELRSRNHRPDFMSDATLDRILMQCKHL